MKKTRSKLRWLVCLLVAAVLMTAGMPAISARADEIALEGPDLIDDELHELGGGGSGGGGNMAAAYSNLPWYANTGSTTNTGRGEVNKVTGQSLMPHVHDKTAVGGVREPYYDELP